MALECTVLRFFLQSSERPLITTIKKVRILRVRNSELNIYNMKHIVRLCDVSLVT